MRLRPIGALTIAALAGVAGALVLYAWSSPFSARLSVPSQSAGTPEAAATAAKSALAATTAPGERELSPPKAPRQEAAIPPPNRQPGDGESTLPATTPEDAGEEDSVEPVIVTPNAGARTASTDGKRGLVILQIGDSHTSADFLTGELRRRLQARYGRGGAGYITAGKPHIGVRSSSLKITASPGWTYKSLQRPDARASEFWLAGYSANASAAGETMSFSSERALIFDTIEIEALAQPGGGAIDIRLDGEVMTHYDLAATRLEPVVIRLLPTRGPTDKVREIAITSAGQGAVNIASIAIRNSRSGVTYNSVGYVGAQVSLVNKFDQKLFASDLKRIDPQIVVLAFGTNEASNGSLNLADYGRSYSRVVDRIKNALPGAVIVVVSPPDFNELSPQCQKEKAAAATCRRTRADATASVATTPAASTPTCVWHTPAKLQQIRDVQRDIAMRHSLVYWNWASIMPAECGAHQWATAQPPLMARDHVHFTIEGYKKSADQFLNTLIPIIEKVRVGANVIPNN